MDPAALLEAARGGDRRALGRLLSLTETAAGDPGGAAAAALEAALTASPAVQGDERSGVRPTVASEPSEPSEPTRPRVVGVTGPPGAGKSTLVGVLTSRLRSEGRTVWVLAVDPTSPVTGGALLGDRIRMPAAGDPGVLVRSLASRGSPGGVAAAVPWAVRVAAALGVDDVLVETVGAGQADVAVAATVDVTVLAVPPGLGDEVQALKAGIAELADIVCVTKGDRPDAAATARQWRAVLGGGPDAPRVVVTSAADGDVEALVEALGRHGDGPGRRRPAPALTAAVARARRAASRGSVDETLVHLGEVLRLRPRQDDRDLVTLEDLAAAAGPGGDGLARLVETVASRLPPDLP